MFLCQQTNLKVESGRALPSKDFDHHNQAHISVGRYLSIESLFAKVFDTPVLNSLLFELEYFTFRFSHHF